MNAQSYKATHRASAEECRAIGDFVWSEDETTLYIVLPSVTGKPALCSERHAALDAIQVTRDPKNRTPRVWHWNGNREAPTLTPSIHWLGNWHGYLTNGELKSC